MATPRRPRRQDADEMDATKIRFSEAYQMESAGTWPSWRDRSRFWSRPDIPPELRRSAEPDPRVLLGPDPPTAAEYTEQRGQWQRERLEWLRRQAESEKK